MAVWRICTSCVAGLPGSSSSLRRTSGPPKLWKRMAAGMGRRIAPDRRPRDAPYCPGRQKSRLLPAGNESYCCEKGPEGTFSSQLERGVVRFAGADADHALDLRDEDLAVADLAGLGGLEDRLDHLLGQVAAHGDLDARLGDKVDHVLGAAIQLGMSALPPKALHFRDRHARHADVRKRGAYVVELEWLDDGGDQFHGRAPSFLGFGRAGVCSFHARQ